MGGCFKKLPIADHWESEGLTGEGSENEAASSGSQGSDSPIHLGQDNETETESTGSHDSDPPTYLEQVMSFKLTQLAAATNNFSADCLLGEGGFGPIYKGKLKRRRGFGSFYREKLKSAGYVVAIRRLLHSVSEGDSKFHNEVVVLSGIVHPNIIDVIGYGNDDGQRFIVYEYMIDGSLEAHLFRCSSDMRPLALKTRMEIASDVAEGLHILHTDQTNPIIHRNLKCSNILLEKDHSGEVYHAKLSDFGLMDRKYGFCVRGFPEMGKPTVESDVFAFGMLIIELITGRNLLGDSNSEEARNLVSWAKANPSSEDKERAIQIADRSLGEVSECAFRRAASLAKHCLHENPSRRPEIGEIKRTLGYIIIVCNNS